MIDNSDDLSNHFNHYNDDQRKCLKFAVISDPHLVSPNFQNDTRLAEESVEIFRETIKQIQFTNTDFIIITGDVMEAKEFGLINLELAFNELSKIDTPWFVLMGNHDSRYRVTKDNYHKIDFIKKFEGHGPNGNVAYWLKKIKEKKIALIGLDTSQERTSEGVIDNQQLKWVENELSRIPKDYFVLVFMHHPTIIFDKIVKDNKDLKMYCLNNHIQMQELYKINKSIKAVISGHNHVRRYRNKDGIHYIGLPSINTWPNMYSTFSVNSKNLKYQHMFINNDNQLEKAKNKLFSRNSSWSKYFANSSELKSYFSKGKNQRILEL